MLRLVGLVLGRDGPVEERWAASNESCRIHDAPHLWVWVDPRFEALKVIWKPDRFLGADSSAAKFSECVLLPSEAGTPHCFAQAVLVRESGFCGRDRKVDHFRS